MKIKTVNNFTVKRTVKKHFVFLKEIKSNLNKQMNLSI